MPATVLIGYDLNQPVQNYTELIEEIKKISSTWWHCLDSTWLVRTDLSPDQIRNRLKRTLDPNDELLVVLASPPAAWSGFDQQCSDWLVTNL
jgi:hypothetical protein